MIRSRADKVYQVIIYTVVSVLLVCSLFPLVYIVGQSLTSFDEWTRRGGFVIFPLEPTLSGYRQILRYSGEVRAALTVSALRTLVGSAIQLLATLVFGYAVSRPKLPGRKLLIGLNLSTILFSGGLIPTFLVIQGTGLYDSFWVYVVPGLVYTWGVLVFKQFFEGVPKSIEESAVVDGASELQLMLRIIWPMSYSVIAAITLFLAVGHWNAWFDAMVYTTTPSLQPLQLLLKKMFSNANSGYTLNIPSSQSLSTYKQVPSSSMRMAVAVVGILPILCIYPFLQKYFIKGVYVGAVKE